MHTEHEGNDNAHNHQSRILPTYKALLEERASGLGLLERRKPLERVVVEVVELLIHAPRDVRGLERLRHGGPREARLGLGVVHHARRAHAQAVAAREEMEAVGVRACERGLEVLVADREPVLQGVLQ